MDEYLKTILGRMVYGPQYGMSEEEIARVFPSGLPVGGSAPAFGPSGVRSLPAAMKSIQSIARRSPDLIKWIQSGRKITIGGPKWTQLTQNLTANQKNMLVKNFDAVRNFIRSDRGAQIVSSTTQPTQAAAQTAQTAQAFPLASSRVARTLPRISQPAANAGIRSVPPATGQAARTAPPRLTNPQATQTAQAGPATQSAPEGSSAIRNWLMGLTLAGLAANELLPESSSSDERIVNVASPKQLGTYSETMADITNRMRDQTEEAKAYVNPPPVSERLAALDKDIPIELLPGLHQYMQDDVGKNLARSTRIVAGDGNLKQGYLFSSEEKDRLAQLVSEMAEAQAAGKEAGRRIRMNRPEDPIFLRPIDLDISLEDAMAPSSSAYIDMLLANAIPRTVELERNFIPRRQITVPPVSPLRGRR
jgi:hypothetical protein